jgi:hypothetical protein
VPILDVKKGEKGPKQHSPNTFYPLLLYNGKEDYNTLFNKTFFLFTDLRTLTTNSSIPWNFTADLKSMMTLLKLSIAKGSECCPFCKVC